MVIRGNCWVEGVDESTRGNGKASIYMKRNLFEIRNATSTHQ